MRINMLESLTDIPADTIVGTANQWMAFYARQRPVMADLIVDNAGEKEIARSYGDKFQKSAVIRGAYEAEDFFPDLGNSGKWLFFTGAPLKDDKGRIIGAIETLQDVTFRKQAEQIMLQRKGISRRQEIALRIADAVDRVFPYAKKDVQTSIVFAHTVARVNLPTKQPPSKPFYQPNPPTPVELHVLRLGLV